jgi:hypothetical protein
VILTGCAPSTTVPRSRTSLAFGVGALLCVGLTGCSGGGTTIAAAVTAGGTPVVASTPPAGASGRVVDPCTLLTPTEAASLLGGAAQHKADPPKMLAQGNGLDVTGHTCDYSLITSDQSGHDIRIQVEAGATRSYFDQDAGSGDGAAIPGLGDAAHGTPGDLTVFSKNTMFEVYGSLAATDGLQQAARLAIAKL